MKPTDKGYLRIHPKLYFSINTTEYSTILLQNIHRWWNPTQALPTEKKNELLNTYIIASVAKPPTQSKVSLSLKEMLLGYFFNFSLLHPWGVITLNR